QIVTPADRSDLLLTGSLANEHRNVAPGHPPAGDRVKQVACSPRPNRELCLITEVVTRNRKTAVRIENQCRSCSVPIGPPQIFPICLELPVVEGILEPAPVRCVE